MPRQWAVLVCRHGAVLPATVDEPTGGGRARPQGGGAATSAAAATTTGGRRSNKKRGRAPLRTSACIGRVGDAQQPGSTAATATSARGGHRQGGPGARQPASMGAHGSKAAEEQAADAAAAPPSSCCCCWLAAARSWCGRWWLPLLVARSCALLLLYAPASS